MSVTDWRGRTVSDETGDLPIDETVSRRREARSAEPGASQQGLDTEGPGETAPAV